MSSILKALRKVEDEKAALGDGNVDLAHDILKRSYETPRNISWLPYVALGLALLGTAAAGWWYFSPPPMVEIASPASVTPPVESQAVVPAPSDQVPPTASEKEAVAPIAETLTPAPAPGAADIPPSIEIPPVIDAVPPTKIESQQLPVLTVDEIVYHQDPASRLAVINDLPVMVGTDIEGARVEEILPDRVRFSYQGSRFEKLRPSE
jgi:general secretion pathway protein B